MPLFAPMDPNEIAEITRLLYTRTYLPGVPIVRKGDAGDAMFLIAGGEALVDVGPGKQVVLKEGDFFGEMALLERRRHRHDVIAKTRCRVYVLDTQSLARLTARHPEILRRIREVASRRAAATEAAGRDKRKRKVRAPSKSERGEPQAV